MNQTIKGRLILLTGLSGSGKSTLGCLLVDHLNNFGVRPAFLLDGDMARSFFENDLAYAPDDRFRVSRRMAFGAATLVENNFDVVMANIAGAKSTRAFFRKKFTEYIECYLKADVQTLIDHDIKSIYRKNLKSKNSNIIGVDIDYEEPDNPDLTLFPYSETPEQSLRKIITYLFNRGPLIGSKADTLESLSSVLKHSKILPQLVITQDIAFKDPERVIQQIREKVGISNIAVRSSCKSEDSKHNSNAGVFNSCLNVPVELQDFMKAVESVKESYQASQIPKPEHEQILIQPMAPSVKMSGVIFTRHKSSDSPYYVINYDDTTSCTDSVTGGKEGKVLFISRNVDTKNLGKWNKLLLAVKELESLFPKFPLDIEFILDKKNEIIILQCRALNIEQYHVSLEKGALEIIEDLRLRFERASEGWPGVPGKQTVLSDMADWNPAEIIGDKPSTFAYSLYRELVTESTWHEARAEQGYFNLNCAPLMMSMARKPYIDTRFSFASLTPASISSRTRSRLVDYYLDKLKRNRHLHDKVEFQVLYTCYDLTLEKRLSECKGISKNERSELVCSLRNLTNNLIVNFHKDLHNDYQKLDELDSILSSSNKIVKRNPQYWTYFNTAFTLLEHTRRLGVLPFAKLARLAFIGYSILNSLVESKLLTSDQKEAFLNSINTIATEFSSALTRLHSGKLSKANFLKKYGHLRMNTYDITSVRYDKMPNQFWKSSSLSTRPKVKREKFQYDSLKIDQGLINAGFEVNSEKLFAFIKKAIQAREDSKFRFTRALSQSIEFISQGGALLDVDRNSLQYTTLHVLARLRNLEHSSLAKASTYLKNKAGEKLRERCAYDLIKLPPVITNPNDIEIVEIQQAKPNFISEKNISAPVLRLSNSYVKDTRVLKGKIIVIENADPGYDWIFSCSIAGLLTKYGGVASHMAIRCSEFNLPGAIGCGEVIFSKLSNSDSILLDCKSQVVLPL